MELGSTWAFQPIKLCLPQMCFGFIGLSSPQWLIVETQSNWATQPTKELTKNDATQPRTCLTQSMLAALTFRPPCFSLCLLCHHFFLNLPVSSLSASWPWLPFASLTSNLSRQCMPGWGPWPAQFWHHSSQPNGQSPASKQLGHFSGTPAPSSPVLCTGPSGQCWTELLPPMPSPWSALLWTEPISPWAGCWSFDCFSDLGLLHRNWGSHIGFCQAASTSSSRCGWWLGHMNRQQIPCLHWDCRWSRRWSRLLLLLGGASHQ